MIYVVSHKEFVMPDVDDFYSVIYVGEKMGKYAEENRFLSDRQGGDHIAAKNPFYCELTALYWIWKNDKGKDPVGLNHYRRYFLAEEQEHILLKNHINTYLKEKQVILPKPLEFRKTVEQFYARTTGYQKDLLAVRKVVQERYPEYISSMEKFLKGHSMSYANMFVMRRTEFELYCEWLFDILFHLEKMIDVTGYTSSEMRVYGYLGELLLNIYVLQNNFDVQYLKILNTEKQPLRKGIVRKGKEVIKEIIYFPSGVPFRRRMKKL